MLITNLINHAKNFFQEEETLLLHLRGSPHSDLDDVTGIVTNDVTLEADEALDVGEAELGAATPLEEITVCLTLPAKVTPEDGRDKGY